MRRFVDSLMRRRMKTVLPNSSNLAEQGVIIWQLIRVIEWVLRRLVGESAEGRREKLSS